MSTETWKPVDDFPDYEVSSLGRIRSSRRKATPRLIHGHANTGGYLQVTFLGDRERSIRLVHGVVAAAFIGPKPEGQQVRHLDGNRTNNAASNLAYGTPSRNVLDSVEHGTHRCAAKTECPQGHAYDEQNTRMYRGRRYCRACQSMRDRQTREQKAAA